MGTVDYSVFARSLQTLTHEVLSRPWDDKISHAVNDAINGQAARELRALVSIDERRTQGAFFTNGALRARFADILSESATHFSFWDPACGAGDLLLAASNQLPIYSSLSDTILRWGKELRGNDLDPTFIEVAKLRLLLAAAARHVQAQGSSTWNTITTAGLFPQIHEANSLDLLGAGGNYSGHLLLNPPFATIRTEQKYHWAQGIVSQAGIFALEAAQALGPGGRITAVLPDVLRSGTRYGRWRNEIGKFLEITHIEQYGQFDEHTDIDVFLLQGTSRIGKENEDQSFHDWWPDADAAIYLQDLFRVRVGPVVDNRDPHVGPLVPYMTARSLSSVDRQCISALPSRQFQGRLVTPPFVAIRRTSRPGPRAGGDARAAGVLVLGDTPIAVDNHLITAEPLDGSESTCKELLDVLRSPTVCRWLDDRIRCRHLTVSAIKAIPWA